MSTFRMVHTEFWEDPKVIEEMTPEDKYFFLYLLTNANTTQIGIYQITKKQMAFDMGYSMETINSLLDRFLNHHQLIMYNEETREVAIKNWGKYNLRRGGKPMLDCVFSELKNVKDRALILYVRDGVENDSIRGLYDTYDDTCHDTSPIRPQYKDKEEDKDKDKRYSRKKVYDHDSIFYKLALFFVEQIKRNNPNFKEPNLNNWSNDIRLMMERDNRTEKQIRYLMEWVQNDSFEMANVMSPVKLRKRFDNLVMKVKQEKEIKSPETKRESQYDHHDYGF